MEADITAAQVLNPTVDFIAGTIRGVAGLVVGFPFDTVKVRLQSASSSQHTSTFRLMLSIAQKDKRLGIRCLFCGISSPIATAAPSNGLVFASYWFLLDVQGKAEEEKAEPTLGQILLAGMGCGIISSLITTPTELIKIRQQTPSSSSFFSPSLNNLPSAREVTLDILRRQGIRGLYRGIIATALRDLGYGSCFVAYKATCWYLPRIWGGEHGRRGEAGNVVHEMDQWDGGEGAGWETLVAAGGVAGIAGWIFTFPMDVVKTRIQAKEGGRYPYPSSTAIAPSPVPSAIQPYPSILFLNLLSSPLPTLTPTPTRLLAWSTQHLVSPKNAKPLLLDPIHLCTLLPNRGHTCLLERTGSYIVTSRTS